MVSIFSKIIAGEIPSYKIAEDDCCYAFLDINPLAKGHTLVVPKEEIDYIYNLDDETLSKLTLFSKRVAKAIQEEVSCLRVGVAVIGLEVPHAHIHLIPLNNMYDIDFSKPKLKMSEDELKDLSERISRHLD